MRSSHSLLYSVLLVLGDIAALLGAFTVAYIIRVKFDTRTLIEPIPAIDFIMVFVALMPVWIVIFALLGLYRQEVYEKRLSELVRLAAGSFLGMLVVIGYDFVSTQPVFPARLVAVWGLLASFCFLVIARLFLWEFRKFAFRYGLWTNNLMIIGSTSTTQTLSKLLGHTDSSGYVIKAVVGAQTVIPENFTGKHFSSLEEGLSKLEKLGINSIIQTELYKSEHRNSQILEAAHANHIAYKFVPAQVDFYTAKSTVELFHGYPVISIHQTPLMGWGRILKRGLDFSVSILLLILLSPFLLLVSLVILVFDFGPLFFVQKRMTRWGREVPIYKFRTLKTKYNGKDPAWAFKDLGREDLIEEYQKNRSKVSDDPRIGRLGRFLRKTSIDELPQLFNVARGDISLVGPRTIPRNELEKDFREKSPLILSVKTGVTGLAQVSGRSDLTIEERIKLDSYYVQNWSLWLDIKILLKTLLVVLRPNEAK